MPEKEVAHLAVETSGHFGSIWQWIVGMTGAGLVGLWGHLTGRIKRLEDTVSTAKMLQDHIEDENKKFDALFANNHDIHAEVTTIGKAVARIEGMLDK